RFAAEARLPNVISFDMGGTTAKACLIRGGVPLEKAQVSIGAASTAGGWSQDLGHVVRVPSIDLVEVGAGGGSIAWIEGGLLKVGPHSAGAEPGPVCYGRGGTEPTVTDADLILGYLDPAFFLGGRMKLDLDGAKRAIEEKIAKPLNLSMADAAWGIHQIANENMANAARVHALERGKDPHRFPLFAFGGAGPVHGYRLAEALG